MTLSLCLALWCAFGSPSPSTSITIARDAYRTDDAVEWLALIEHRGLVSGYVTAPGAALVGVLPLRASWKRLTFEGGALYASRPVPPRGTTANWLARATVHVAGPLQISWWHVSNAGAGDAQNPSLDAIAIGWRF